MANFVKLGTLDELPPGGSKEVEHEGRIFALFNVDGVISAIDGLCPHQGGPLADGPIEGSLVYCPWHDWGFDIRTGQSMVNPTWKQAVYPVKVEDGSVWVAIQP